MIAKKNLVLIAVTVLSGCANMNQQPVAVSNPRVVNRDLTAASTDTSRTRVLSANLAAPQTAAMVTTNQTMQPAMAAAAVKAPAQIGTRFKFETTDLSFKQALTRWAKMEGWQVAWEVEKDFPGRLYAEFPNQFEEAVHLATNAYLNSDYPIKACGYDNKVVRVVRYLGNDKECDLAN